jgi:hypothetical protein
MTPTPPRVRRGLRRAIPLALLVALLGFIAAIHLDGGATASVAIRLATAGAIDPQPSIRSPQELPIRVRVETAESLQRWAESEGRARIAAAAPLSPWEVVTLGRFLAIDGLVMRNSEYFGNDPVWLMLALSSESALDPLAKGIEPGDRGLGQVGYTSEAAARAWATDGRSPYRVAGFDPSPNIWEPAQNILLASIVLRSLYAMDDVETHPQAYARYTHGLKAVQGGNLSSDSEIRVKRAQSYEASTRLFFALANLDLAGSAAPLLEDRFVRRLLAINKEHEDGMAMYRALRDAYVAEAARPDITPWQFALLMREALTYSQLEHVVTGTPDDRDVAAIADLLQAGLPVIRALADAALTDLVTATLAEARSGDAVALARLSEVRP